MSMSHKPESPRPDASDVLNSGTAEPVCETVPAEAGGGLWGLPQAVWSRLAVLFPALASIKVVLLVGLRKHLCEIHWRVEPPATTWWNYFGFGLFLSLGMLSLLRLAQRCRSAGLRTVRTANGMILGLGLLFICLTFHSGDNNYFYPITTGVLRWTSLGSYLSLDLFFRCPFLAAWILGYVFMYYLLARTGHELWTLHLTAVCAGAYALVCLGELAGYRNELLVVDCLGAVSLWAQAGSRRTVSRREPGISGGSSGILRLGWMLAPAGWALCFAVGLIGLSSPQEREPIRYFLMLLSGTTIVFAVATVLAHRHGFLKFWKPLVLFYFAAFLVLANGHYPMAANYNNALCLGLEFPRYFAGELALVLALALCAAVYCRLWPQRWSAPIPGRSEEREQGGLSKPLRAGLDGSSCARRRAHSGSRGGFWWLDVLSLGAIATAFMDLRLSQIMGARLDWDVLSFGDSPKMMWRMARPYLPGAIAGLVGMIVVYSLVVRGCQWYSRRTRAFSSTSRAGRDFFCALASFVLLGGVGLLTAFQDKAEGQAVVRLVQTSPLWKRVANHPLSREEFLQSAKALGLGDFATAGNSSPGEARRDLNVVLIFQESSYNRHLSLFGSKDETQPLLAKYKGRMELFPCFFSNFAGSIQARFATFTSLYPIPNFNVFTRERVGVKSLFEVLHDNGYTCSLFYSSFFDYTGFRDFLRGRGIDAMYDADTMPGQRKTERVAWGLREEETLGAIRSQIRKYAGGSQRFFLTYVPAAPHYPYDGVPVADRKFKPGRLGDFTPFYLNEMLAMDRGIASILDQLRDCGLLDNTLVIITNDHGEWTGEDGGAIGHGWYLTPELANTPLIVMDPQRPGYRLNYTIGSQIDVLPTVLDILKVPLPPNQLYEGRSLYAALEGDTRLVYSDTYDEYGIIAGNRFIFGTRKAGGRGTASSCPKSVYVISNQGNRTLFTEDRGARETATPIRPFEEFQENLLRNYSFYCEAVTKAGQTASIILRARGRE